MLLKKTQNNDFFGAAPRGGRGNLSFYNLFPYASALIIFLYDSGCLFFFYENKQHSVIFSVCYLHYILLLVLYDVILR